MKSKTDPAIVVLDTLNRSLNGSESRDEDMSAYVRAADAIREKFDCAVIIVHHCGVVGTRPRGHTSLSGAADAQIAVRRDDNRNVVATIEFMKDGTGEGDSYVSSLVGVDLCEDEDGDIISSCVIVETMESPRFVKSGRPSEGATVALRALREAIAAAGCARIRSGVGRASLCPGHYWVEKPGVDARFFSTGAQGVNCEQSGKKSWRHIRRDRLTQPTRQMLRNLESSGKQQPTAN